jgi:hypothetical protein
MMFCEHEFFEHDQHPLWWQRLQRGGVQLALELLELAMVLGWLLPIATQQELLHTGGPEMYCLLGIIITCWAGK